jgi:hypothetical protein
MNVLPQALKRTLGQLTFRWEDNNMDFNLSHTGTGDLNPHSMGLPARLQLQGLIV